MASERDIFQLSGPLHLTNIDWTDVDHRRSFAASMVQGVYIMQRDRQENRDGSEALAPPWWNFFNFDLQSQLIDNADSSIFGAVYKFNPNPSPNNNTLSTNFIPSHIIAFRGTVTKGDAFSRDLELDLHFVKNVLHQSSRFEIAIQAVRSLIASGNTNIWLAGHSLGSAMAMLVGKNIVKNGFLIETHLFNPPFVSAPIETIKNKKVKHGLRIAGSFVTAGLAFAVKMKNGNQQRNNVGNNNQFSDLSSWIPCLYVNPKDPICSEYIGYFGHRRKMENVGAAAIERLASQHSIAGLFMDAIGKESHEPLHLLPSANLTVNLSRARDLKEAHGIHQWWRYDQQLESRTYRC